MRTMRHVALLATGAVMLLGLAACDVFTSDEKRLQRAAEQIDQGAYAAAMVELRNVLGADPKNAEAQYLVARANLMMGNADGAQNAIDAAAAAGADAARLAPLRARVWLQKGKYAELLAAVDGGKLPLAPAEASDARVQALGRLNRCDEALHLLRADAANAARSVARRVAAECYAKQGNLARANAELDAALAADSKDAESWMARGQMMLLAGDKAEAEKAWNQALAAAGGHLGIPQQVVLLVSLADLQSERGDRDAVKATHEALVPIAPQAPVTELLLARVQFMNGDAESAANTLRQLLTHDEDMVAAHRMLVAVYLAQGNFEQAGQQLDWLEHASNPAPDLKAARIEYGAMMAAPADSEERWVRLGLIQRAMGETAAARKSLARAADIAPDSPKARLAMVNLELYAGDHEAALKLADELAAKHPDDVNVLMAAAQARAAAGQFAPALAALDQAMAKAPGARVVIAQHQLRLRAKQPQPNEPLETWLATHPDDLLVRGMLAESLRVAGDNPGAIREYEKLLARQPNNPVFLNNLAWVYYLEKDPRALPTAKRAWQAAPKMVSVLDTYGWILVESGAAKEGIDPLSKADAQVGAAQPSVRYHYAVALARGGQVERARVMLAALLVDHDDFAERAAASKLLADLNGSGTT